MKKYTVLIDTICKPINKYICKVYKQIAYFKQNKKTYAVIEINENEFYKFIIINRKYKKFFYVSED